MDQSIREALVNRLSTNNAEGAIVAGGFDSLPPPPRH
jgi:hypothetical protein